MSVIYFTRCSTCNYDLSEVHYRKVVLKENLNNIFKDIQMSCCLMNFIGQMNTIKIYGAPKHDAIIRKSNNDIMPIQY
jgi:hypothetical protein